MAFGTFAAVSFIGFLMSFGIRGEQLESDDWSEDEEETDEEEDIGTDADHEETVNERTNLVRK